MGVTAPRVLAVLQPFILFTEACQCLLAAVSLSGMPNVQFRKAGEDIYVWIFEWKMETEHGNVSEGSTLESFYYHLSAILHWSYLLFSPRMRKKKSINHLYTFL